MYRVVSLGRGFFELRDPDGVWFGPVEGFRSIAAALDFLTSYLFKRV